MSVNQRPSSLFDTSDIQFFQHQIIHSPVRLVITWRCSKRLIGSSCSLIVKASSTKENIPWNSRWFDGILFFIDLLSERLECSPMTQETGVQSQVQSYQRLKKWYLMSPCLTLSIIRYGSRVKWSNPGNGVVPPPTPCCSSYWKGSLLVTLE